ncbi:hypothetical protein IFM89_017927 [Coptis chinensis]|uniref:Disease resistance R13L4/SHOC-2-like LRR domain-containing protein n=1 Tax=Coptis chinensis TaxID=261450 RepID=A0A835HVN6_9MAGN|nr:hypothetical protein IFM89_017927 [Coptis chinensis]
MFVRLKFWIALKSNTDVASLPTPSPKTPLIECKEWIIGLITSPYQVAHQSLDHLQLTGTEVLSTSGSKRKGDARTDAFKKVKVSSSTSAKIVELETDATSISDKQEKKEHWLQRVLRQQGCPQKKDYALMPFQPQQQLERQPKQQLERLQPCRRDDTNTPSIGNLPLSRNVVALNIYSFVTSLAPKIVVNSVVLAPLFPITTLTKLDISSNSIQGELPANGIVNFTKLLHLDLRENSFNGSIHTKLFRLQRLRYLDMNSNMFNGILSQEVRALRNLRVLNLAENFLYREIPMEIGNLTQLRQLALRKNRFSGGLSNSLLHLTELQALDLRNNSLSMQIPTIIGTLSNISTLALSKNQLTGGITLSLQNFSKLATLQLDSNLLSAPKCMLSQLSLRSCRVAGPIPKWISTQKTLDFLDLSENELDGNFPEWLA